MASKLKIRITAPGMVKGPHVKAVHYESGKVYEVSQETHDLLVTKFKVAQAHVDVEGKEPVLVSDPLPHIPMKRGDE